MRERAFLRWSSGLLRAFTGFREFKKRFLPRFHRRFKARELKMGVLSRRASRGKDDDGDSAGGMKWNERRGGGGGGGGGVSRRRCRRSCCCCWRSGPSWCTGWAASSVGGKQPVQVKLEPPGKQAGRGLTLLPVSWDRYGFSSSPITE